MPNRATAAQAGRKIAKALKRSKKPLTPSKLESETGLDELDVSMGLSWLRNKGYVSKDFRNRWTLNRGRFAVNPKDNPVDTEDISYARSQIRRWAKSTGRAEPMQFYTCKGWERQSGKKTNADLVVCCDTNLRRALRRADSGKGSANDMEIMEEFSEVIGDAGFHYKIKPTHIELYSLSINPKEKKKKKTLKQRAKTAGRKIKKGAKTDVGRAGIGAGAGALVLGPIGAVAGAGIAMATKKDKKKSKKKNPDKTVKLSSLMGNLLLDYQRVSDHVEHLATATLRGDRVPVSVIRKARADLHKAKKIQVSQAEKEQIGELIEAMDRVIAKHKKRTMNPASLETAIKRQRQKKARKGASRAMLASKAASSADKLSLRKKLASINPSSYVEQVPHLSDKALEGEHKAISNLIARARRSPEASKRMLNDLVQIRKAITEEKKRRRKAARPMARRMSSRSTSRSNPPKSKVKSSVPPGTKITRVPPGKAKGAEPLSPYAHEYTESYERRGSGQKESGMVPVGVAATYGRRMMGNPSSKIRRHKTFSKWVDAQEMARKHPDTFEAPSLSDIKKVDYGDMVKWSTGYERPWFIVLDNDGKEIAGILDNQTLDDKYKVGDLIYIEHRHVFDIEGANKKSIAKADAFIKENIPSLYKEVAAEVDSKKKKGKKRKAKNNPRKTGRKHGRFASVYTPTQSDLKLLDKYDAFKTIEGKDPRVIEEFMKGLRERDKKSGGFVRDNELDRLAEIYRKRRKRHLFIVTSPDSTPGEIARHQKMVNDAERDLALYAEMRNMEPEDLRKYMEHAKRKQKAAKSRKRKSNPRNPTRGRGPDRIVPAVLIWYQKNGYLNNEVKEAVANASANPPVFLKFLYINLGKSSMKLPWRNFENLRYELKRNNVRISDSAVSDLKFVSEVYYSFFMKSNHGKLPSPATDNNFHKAKKILERLYPTINDKLPMYGAEFAILANTISALSNLYKDTQDPGKIPGVLKDMKLHVVAYEFMGGVPEEIFARRFQESFVNASKAASHHERKSNPGNASSAMPNPVEVSGLKYAGKGSYGLIPAHYYAVMLRDDETGEVYADPQGRPRYGIDLYPVFRDIKNRKEKMGWAYVISDFMMLPEKDPTLYWSESGNEPFKTPKAALAHGKKAFKVIVNAAKRVAPYSDYMPPVMGFGNVKRLRRVDPRVEDLFRYKGDPKYKDATSKTMEYLRSKYMAKMKRRSNPRKSKVKSSVPPGTKITKLPPAPARDFEDIGGHGMRGHRVSSRAFDPYGPEVTLEQSMFEEGVERGKFKSGFGKRKINPRHTGRKHGRFASMYTPTEADIKLLQKHDAIEAIEGMSPKEIEVFMDRLRMVGSKRKSNPKGRIKQKKAKRIRDKELDRLSNIYTQRKMDRMSVLLSPDSTPTEIARHDKMVSDAEQELELYVGKLLSEHAKRKSNPKGRIKQKKAKRKLPIKKGVLTPIPDDIEIERLPMGVAQGHDTFRQREFMHSPITSSKGHYRTRKPNPKSWDKVVKGAVQNMSDKELVALHKKQSKKLHSSHAPERQFGTEGVKMLESTIELTEKEISRRGLSPRKLNPSKPLSSKRRKYMTPVDWAKLNMKNYHKHMKAFDSSMEVDDPDYSCLIAANLDAYGAEINYRDAGDKKNANKMMTERKRISKELSTLLK